MAYPLDPDDAPTRAEAENDEREPVIGPCACWSCGFDDGGKLRVLNWYDEEYPPIPPPRGYPESALVIRGDDEEVSVTHSIDECPACGEYISIYSVVARVDYDALVRSYVAETLVCSFWHMMQDAPSYPAIRDGGMDAVPALLRNLRLGPERGGGGMCVMHALAEVVGEWPGIEEHTKPVAPGWVGTDVDAAREAWLRWGRERELVR